MTLRFKLLVWGVANAIIVFLFLPMALNESHKVEAVHWYLPEVDFGEWNSSDVRQQFGQYSEQDDTLLEDMIGLYDKHALDRIGYCHQLYYDRGENEGCTYSMMAIELHCQLHDNLFVKSCGDPRLRELLGYIDFEAIMDKYDKEYSEQRYGNAKNDAEDFCAMSITRLNELCK
jgi:hypothetical protein